MVYYKNNQWNMCTEKIKYTQRGDEITQYIGTEGRDWWIEFAEKWEHTEIIEFISVATTGEQLERLDEINQLNISEGFGAELSDYVKFGIFPEGFNHILRPIQILKQQDDQDEYLVDNDFRLSLIEMGVDINDL